MYNLMPERKCQQIGQQLRIGQFLDLIVHAPGSMLSLLNPPFYVHLSLLKAKKKKKKNYEHIFRYMKNVLSHLLSIME